MDPKLIALFRAALDLSPGERAAYLDQHCHDPALRTKLEPLLRDAEQAEDFDDCVSIDPLNHASTPNHDLHHASAAGQVSALARPSPAQLLEQAASPLIAISSVHAGEQIGSFRLLHLIGQGGMGTVWLAERIEGFVQRVAIKWSHIALRSPAAVARFTQERVLLAKLNHPNIARIVDGGNDHGSAWYAMEYVDGLALDDYIAERSPSLRERIQIMIAICQAVQFAHQHLIVHRDLKPSNVLVQADGSPKLLDFGIAKQLEGEDSITQSQAPMTFAYAAPEQIRGDAIGTSCDVYALGVILFEMLTGTRPHKASSNPNGDHRLSVLQAITDTDAPAPSAILSATTIRGDASGTTKSSVSNHARIAAKQLRGDLDTIVLHALQRDPARRYASAQALADDLERFLRGDVIAAQKDSLWYRTGKFMRRHPFGVAASVLGISALIGISIYATQQASIANQERQNALQQLEQTEIEVRRQEALTQHISGVVARALSSPETLTSKQLMQWLGDPNLLGNFGDPSMQQMIQLSVADLLIETNDSEGALKVLDGVIPHMNTANVKQRIIALNNQAIARIRLGELDAAEISLNQAEGLFEKNDRSYLHANLRAARGQWLRAKGHGELALIATREAGEWASLASDGSPFARGTLAGSAATGLLMMGDVENAKLLSKAAVAIWADGKVSQNVSATSIAMLAPSADFLQGQVLLALTQMNEIAKTPAPTESVPMRAGREMSRAKVLATLQRKEDAENLMQKQVGDFCQLFGVDSLECIKASLSQVDNTHMLGDAALARNYLDAVNAKLKRRPVAQLQDIAQAFGDLIAASQAPTESNLNAVFKRLGAENQPAMGLLSSIRQLLVLAEQLDARGHRDAALQVARVALRVSKPKLQSETAASPSHFRSEIGMDANLLTLWQARIAESKAPPRAMQNLIVALGQNHPWVLAHQKDIKSQSSL